MFFKKYKTVILTLVISSVISWLVLTIITPKAAPLMLINKSNSSKKETKIHFTAIGDSLTEGVGDTTNNGGFIPFLKNDLLESLALEVVTTDNFGKKGDTVLQVQEKIIKNTSVQESLKKADFITLTVGGNDLIAAITKEFSKSLSTESFTRYREQYATELVELYKTIRKYNPEAPVYQMGIYNPVQLSFGDITEFSEIVTKWDQETEAVLEEQNKVFFVSVNELISNGLEIESSNKTTESEVDNSSNNKNETIKETESKNNLISDSDNFHPNNMGYQLIANCFKEKIEETSQEWWLDKNETSR